MKDGVLVTLATTLAGLSVAAVGGANALTPALRDVVVQQRAWMTDEVFGQLFALSQASPGPNVLMASAVGWKVAGLAGLAVATVAILLPSSLIALVVGRVVERQGERPWLKSIRGALAPMAIGLLFASGLVMARSQNHSLIEWTLTLGAAGLAMRRLNPAVILALAAAAGWALGR